MQDSQTQAPSSRTTLRRKPERGSFDPQAIRDAIDDALLCHVGIVHDGTPVVIPTCFGRVGDYVYLHGSRASRMLQAALDGQACVTITNLDALVVARSAMHHSMNYRSVVLFGKAEVVTDAGEKLRALDAIVEQVLPGRTGETRPPSDVELAQTLVVRLPLTEASLKQRSGQVTDAQEDLSLPHWAGLVPLRLVAGEPEADAGVGDTLPPSVKRWAR